MKASLVFATLMVSILASPTACGGDSLTICSLQARQEKGHSDHGAKGGGAMGGAPMGDITANPTISALVGSVLYYATSWMPKMRVFKTENAEPTFKKTGAKHVKLWYGPFNLTTVAEKQKKPNTFGLDPQGTSFYNQADGFPKDITILSARVETVFQDGSPAGISGGVYNHHIALADASKTPTKLAACPGQKARSSLPISLFTGVGEDKGSYTYSTKEGDFDSGFYIGKKDDIFLSAEIVNYTNETRVIYAVIDIEYTPGKAKFDVSSETLSVTQCDGTGMGIRPQEGQNKFSVTSQKMVLQMDGYIFGVRGHLHDGGVNVPLMINGKVICDSLAKYGGKGAESGNWSTISGMSECNDPIPVKKGDTLTIGANYDLDTHPPRGHAGGGMAEEMGLAIFSFAQTNPSVSTVPPVPSRALLDSLSNIPGMSGLAKFSNFPSIGTHSVSSSIE